MGDEIPIRLLGDTQTWLTRASGNSIEARRLGKQRGSSPFGRILLLIPCSILYTVKDRNLLIDIMMFNKHHENLSEGMDRCKGLTTKSPSSWHRSLASNLNFYDHVSFHLKYEIDHAVGGKLRNKNTDESWEIIETSPSTTMRAG
ncbi:hypothetical protein Tco_0799004 [Tanacetum coccineum]